MSKTQAIRMVIDHKDLFGTEHTCAGRSQQTDWPSSINGDTGTSANLGIGHSLPGCGYNIGQKQYFFIRQGTGNLKRSDIAFGNPHIFGLTAWHTAIQMAITKQGGTWWNL